MQLSRNRAISLVGLLALIVLIFSFSRGLVPLLTGDPSHSSIVYSLSWSSGVLLGFLGIDLALHDRGTTVGPRLRAVLLFNLFLFFIWIFPVLVLERELYALLLIVRLAIFPFAIYALTRLPRGYVLGAFRWATLLIAITVLWDYLDLNLPIGAGLDAATQRQLLLRPDNFEGFGRTGDVFRPVGILGHRPHDGSNVLAMLAVFWLAMTIVEPRRRSRNGTLAVLAILALVATQVASNIVAFLAGLTLLFLLAGAHVRLKDIARSLVVLILLGLGARYLMSNFFANPIDILFHWTGRFASEEIWTRMTDLGTRYPLDDWGSLLVGHSTSLDVSRIGYVTEVGFVALLVELGVIHFSVFMGLLMFPLLRFKNADREQRLNSLPYVLALVVGILSLWHYGSVLRTTNIFIFFAMYAQVLVLTARVKSEPDR